jgi:hypothetical protein
VAAFDGRVEVLDQPGGGAVLLAAIAGQLDEVELVRDRNGAREIGDEDRARLQRGDEDRVLARVVASDLVAELTNPLGDLRGREVDLAAPRVGRGGQLARVSLYRWASRSMSRL